MVACVNAIYQGEKASIGGYCKHFVHKIRLFTLGVNRLIDGFCGKNCKIGGWNGILFGLFTNSACSHRS
jgi:hypothetical protein